MPLLSLEPFIHPDDLFVEADVDESERCEQWWVLHTRPRAEKTLARRFMERGTPFFLPLYNRVWRKQGRQFRSYLPLFPGYMFLKGDHDQRRAALETNLVAYVLTVVDQHQLRADLERVYRLIATGVPLAPEDRLSPGDMVQIVKGPLRGLEGKVLRRGAQLKLIVEVRMLGRAVSAEVESWTLEPTNVGPMGASRCGSLAS